MAREHERLDPVTELLLECLGAIETRGLEALEEACVRYPQHARELRQRIEPLCRAGLVEPGDVDVPARLGDFVLLDELGGGGMGVVYRARQESLGREVALKLIRSDQLALPDARARFRREVEVVARLQHPGIVPVFAFGEEGGTPYFAMERVQGATLGEVLEQLEGRDPATLSGTDLARVLRTALDRRGGVAVEVAHTGLFAKSWSEACLEMTLQVARALAHAHGQGVLHRDLKPSNVLLTADGRVLLFDFGLSSSDWMDRLTRSGSVFGSLPYMAPEQVTGRAADRRTDVYSLGVTLYELLCLRLPYGDTSAVELREAILEGNPPSIRARNPAVAVDAATVCLKAMDRDPERRYSSADGLARDLENALALRPVEARPAGAALRLRRWAQRSPARATAVVLGVLLVAVAPTVFAVQRHVANQHLRDALDEAERERVRAEQNLSDAFDSILIVFDRLGGSDLVDVPGIDPLRTDLYELLLDRLEELARQRDGHEWVERLRARVLQRLATAQREVGRPEEALESAAASVEAFEGLRESAAASSTEQGRAAALDDRAEVLVGEGRQEEALVVRREVVEILDELWTTEPHDDGLRERLANATNNLASTLMALGRLDESRSQFLRGLALLEPTVTAADPDDPIRIAYANTMANLSIVERLCGLDAEGGEHAVEARAALESILRDRPNDRTALDTLSAFLANESATWPYGTPLEDCERLARRGLELTDRLLRDHPESTGYARRRNRLELHLASSVASQGRLEEALSLYDEAILAAERGAGDSDDGRYHVAMLASQRSLTLRRLDRDAEARDDSRTAVAMLESLSEERPHDRDVRQQLGIERLALARIEARTRGDVDFETVLDQVHDDVDDVTAHAGIVASFLAEAAVGLRARGFQSEADRALERGFEYLADGLSAGSLTVEVLEQDDDLGPYRDSERWSEWIANTASDESGGDFD